VETFFARFAQQPAHCWWPGLLFCCLLSGQALAFQLNTRHYSTSDGLPQVQVLSVAQDEGGYIWIGTYSGLSRFNGRDFRHFQAADGLLSNDVTALAAGNDGQLWIGTGSGLCRHRDGSIECFENKLLQTTQIGALALFGSNLWLATDQGLFRFSDGRIRQHLLIDGMRQPSVEGLAVDQDRLWIATSQGLFVKPAPDAKVQRIAAAGSQRISAIAADRDTVWAAGAQGLFRIDPEDLSVNLPDQLDDIRDAEVVDLLLGPDGELWGASSVGLIHWRDGQFRRLSTANGLASNLINRLTLDREGLLWLAHDNGLSKILPGPFVGYTAESGLIGSFVRTMAEDSSGRLWLGTRLGLQILPVDEHGLDMDQGQLLTGADGLIDERIFSIAFADDRRSLLATSHGLVEWWYEQDRLSILTEEDGLPSNRTRALLVDRNGWIWVSTVMGTAVIVDGVVRSIEEPDLADAYAMRIREDEHGCLWFATIQHGLLIRSPNGDLRRLGAQQGLSDEMLWDLAPSEDNAMWVGSNGDGLFRVHEDGRIDRWTTADGLANDFVWQVLQDRDGRVWAYTNRGLSRKEAGGFRSFGEHDGLLHLEGAATSILEMASGQLWFGSADGLMSYQPERERRIEVAPPVEIEEVWLGTRQIEAGIRLPYQPGSLRFRFAALSFHNERSNRFRYRLRGAESEWTETTLGDGVSYGSLGAGEYVFEVMAVNAQGIWSEMPAQFDFEIQPAWWQSWWLRSLAIVAMLLMLWLIMRWRLRTLEYRQRELEAIVEQRTQELSDANERLQYASRTDQLTGLPNRRYLMDRVDKYVARAHRLHQSGESGGNRHIVFMMIDIDHFKLINDRYGHDIGDQVLIAQSHLIQAQLRETDDLIRWGGEEFLVVARHAEIDQCWRIAERIVRAAAEQTLTLEEVEEPLHATCSVGLACYPFHHDQPNCLDWENVVKLADQAVYQAKSRGRNGWVWISPGPNFDPQATADFSLRVRNELPGMQAAGEIVLRTS
jgi:diguanylate cyclase (GGDEF)-like protein